mmetsp:Transcript_36158/g.77123  ORF Transcript_36158/g.77123 Transcript_36158/m.77123 type:complete len:273 (-) Transcript_36158:39-857(-)
MLVLVQCATLCIEEVRGATHRDLAWIAHVLIPVAEHLDHVAQAHCRKLDRPLIARVLNPTIRVPKGPELDRTDTRTNLHRAGDHHRVGRQPLRCRSVTKVASDDLRQRARRCDAGAHGEVLEPREEPRPQQSLFSWLAARKCRHEQLEHAVRHEVGHAPSRAIVQLQRAMKRGLRVNSQFGYVEASELTETASGAGLANPNHSQLNLVAREFAVYRNELLTELGTIKLAQLRQYDEEGLAQCEVLQRRHHTAIAWVNDGRSTEALVGGARCD